MLITIFFVLDSILLTFILAWLLNEYNRKHPGLPEELEIEERLR